MESFLTVHDSKIKGTLSGFDRIRFRGTLRWIANVRGLLGLLFRMGVLLKDFKDYALSLTETIRIETERLAQQAGRPVIYLHSSSQDKESLAKSIAVRDGITQGLVCVLTCVESCRTFGIWKNRETKRLDLQSVTGKCLHQYFYYQDPQWGWLHVRLQTWLPFTIHVVLNGRDWLACQLRRAGVDYEQRDNCFVDVADMDRAQDFLDRQVQYNWTWLLNRLQRRVHPSHSRLFGQQVPWYYWSADQTEWATDVLFHSPKALADLYPRLVQYGITTFGCQDVLRFLGRSPQAWRFHASEIQSSLCSRPEGIRLKHSIDHNSIKMYDKQGSVLRVETTINNPRDMRSYRASEANPEGPKSWRGLRKGVADLPRRAEISQAANARYLERLAAVEHSESLEQTTQPLTEPTTWKQRRVRALNPLSKADARLLQAVSRGEFTIKGFRNADLLPLLFDRPAKQHDQRRRQSAKITRLLRLLRGHSLIQKISRTHRYRLTEKGSIIISALQAARKADTRKLSELAA